MYFYSLKIDNFTSEIIQQFNILLMYNYFIKSN